MPTLPPWLPLGACDAARLLYSLRASPEERERLDRLVTDERMHQVWRWLEKSGSLDKAGMVLLSMVLWQPAISTVELRAEANRARDVAGWLRNTATRRDAIGAAEAQLLRSAADAIEAIEVPALESTHGPHVVCRHRTDPQLRGFIIHLDAHLRGIFGSRWRRSAVRVAANVLFEANFTVRQVTDRTPTTLG